MWQENKSPSHTQNSFLRSICSKKYSKSTNEDTSFEKLNFITSWCVLQKCKDDYDDEN